MTFTTDELKALIKLYGAVPAQQPAFNNANLLRLINNEYRNIIVPKLILLNEEYFVTYSDTTITTGTQTIAIPEKAIASKLREVKIIDGEIVQNVPLLDIDTLDNTNDFGFYVRGNNLYLQSADDFTSQSLRMYYYERPNELVLTTSAALVATDTGSAYTVSNVPSTFGSSAALDLIGYKPPFTKKFDNVTCTIVTTTITPAMYTAAVAGDYLALTGQSPIVQLPAEWFELLAQGVVVKMMESQGDGAGLQMAMQRYAMLDQMATGLVSMRVKGEPRKILRKNGLFQL